MRVWALASCSGLLALAACSTEQASSPTPPADQPPGDDAAQVQSRAGLAAVGSSPVAEPESGSKQLLTQGARPRLLSTRTASTISSTEVAGQTLPQSAQLRERLQRLRAQQGSRLTASTPLVTVPLPTSVAQGSVAQGSAAQGSVAQGTSPRPQAQSPAAVAGGSPPATPSSVPPAQNGQAEAQAIAQPVIAQPSGPGSNLTASASTHTATNLGAPVAANIARSYPISPARHQGYSARLNQTSPVLTTAASVAPVAPGAQAVRLHGEAPALATAATNPPPALAPTAATPVPTAPAPDSVQTRNNTAPTVAQPRPSAPPSGVAAGQPVNPSGLQSQDAQSTGLGTTRVTTRPQPAIAPPESLPLNQAGPRVSAPRTVAAPDSSPGTSVPSQHLGQADPATISPLPQDVKGQPAIYCLSNNEVSSVPTITTQDWGRMQPKNDAAGGDAPGQVGRQRSDEAPLEAVHCPGGLATDDAAAVDAPVSDASVSEVAIPNQTPVLSQD